MSEGGVSPEEAGIAVQELPEAKLEKDVFQQAKIRIEKSKRIKDDLTIGHEVGKTIPQRRQDRVEEVEVVEVGAKQRPESPRDYKELFVDARGYQEQRYNASYVSPTGEKLSEQLVMLARLGQNGQWEFLTVPDSKGGPIAFNADLYDSKLTSRLHAQPVGGASYKIPMVDGRGAYTGITSLVKSK